MLVWLAQQIATVAVDWEIYTRTNSAMALGWIGLVQALPIIVLALPAGHLADRYSRKAIVILCAAISTAAIAALVAIVALKLPELWIYSLVLLDAMARAIGWTARGSLMPQLVPSKIFTNAVTWNSTTYQIAAVIGPAMGGGIIAWSVPGAFAASAAMQFVSVLLMLGLRPIASERSTEPATLRTLLAGVRFVIGTPLIAATISLDLFAVLLGGAVYLLPIYAKDILHVDATGFGMLRAAPAIGAVTMAMFLAHRPPMRRPGVALLWAIVGFGVATIIFGVSRWFWLSMLMLALTGAFDNISVLVRHSLVQLLTPDKMRGRVTAVNNVFIGASNDLGGLESGFTAAWFGVIPSVVAGGVGTILVVLAANAIWPQVRKLGALHELRPGPVTSASDAEGLA